MVIHYYMLGKYWYHFILTLFSFNVLYIILKNVFILLIYSLLLGLQSIKILLQSLEGNARQSQRKQNHVFVNLRWKDLEKSRNHIILPFCDNAVSFFVSDASVSIVSWTSCLSTCSWWSTGWGFILVHHVTPFNLQSKGKTYVYIYIMWEFQNKKKKTCIKFITWQSCTNNRL